MTRRSIGRLLAWVSYALAASLLVLVAARYLGLPVAAAVVTGKSMEPSIRFGDLVVLEKVEDPHSLKPGEVVLWCASPRSCVLHRLVEIRDGVAVTKGDANPYPDPPVPIRLVHYRAVIVVPREAYATPIILYVAVDAYEVLRRARLGEVKLDSIYAAVLVTYAAALFLAPLAAPHPPGYRDVIQQLAPRADLVSVKLLPDGSVEAYYTLKNVGGFEPLHGCKMTAGGAATRCMVLVEESSPVDARILVQPLDARRFYLEAYKRGAKSIAIEANISLGNALLKAKMLYAITWSPLRVKAGECRVTIENPNPGAAIPLTLEITVYRLGRGPAGSETIVGVEKYTLTLDIPPASTRELELPPSSRAIVRMRYPKPGGGWAVEGVNSYCPLGGGSRG